MTTWVFDLDGTISDASSRLHYIRGKKRDWDGFFSEIENDPPFQPMINLIKSLSSNNHAVILQTGRPENYRSATSKWLSKHGLEHSYDVLLMREKGDHSPNTVVKLKFLEWIIDYANSKDILWFEDSQQVVQMINRQGILALSAEHFLEVHQEDLNLQEIPYEGLNND